MSVRNLEFLLRPASLAIIGASQRSQSVGKVLASNLFRGGFQGPIMPVHPRSEAVEGVLAYRDVAALPRTPDLAVIATPPDTVAPLIHELGARGTKAAVIVTAGFGAAGEDGKASRQAVLDAARPHCLRIVGPNCLGLQVPALGLNASFGHIQAARGGLAFVTQSGAMVTAMLDWTAPKGIGFSQVVSLGDMADVDFGDMLDYLAIDPATRAVLLYVEAITDARKFMSAARAAARVKPVIVIKAGRYEEGARAAASHTGALAGADEVYDAAFRRAGMLRVRTLDELFSAAETLSSGIRVRGDRLAIMTNGGGLGVLACDALAERGGKLADLPDHVIGRLDAVLPPTWSRSNPIDLIGDATGERYAAAIECLLEDRSADALLVLHCPVAVADASEVAAAVVGAVKGARRPVLAAWPGDFAGAKARKVLAGNGLAVYQTPEDAVSAFTHLVTHQRNQALLMETPESLPEGVRPDREAARAGIEAALADGRNWLTEPEAKQVLAAYGIPVVPTRIAADSDEAALAAEALGFPVALKILSPDITHKSDVGGVLLQLENAAVVRAAGEGLLARVRRLQPEARIAGLTVQTMIERGEAHELILGAKVDRQFGPIILFGAGGTAVEVVRDRAVALPPLNLTLARQLMADTRIHALLQGYRDRPAAAIDGIALALVRLSQLVSEIAEVVEVDINPLLADSDRVIALDARIKVAPAEGPAERRLALRPYPEELSETIQLADGHPVRLRPIRPEDEPSLQEGFKKLTEHDVRMRFFAPMKALDHRLAARLSQIDYDREMAFVAYDPEIGAGDLWGVVRCHSDPDKARAEFAITVRSDRKQRGLGSALMNKLVDFCREQGVGELWGDVLTENRAMIALAKRFGFRERRNPDEAGVTRATLTLGRIDPDQSGNG